MHSTVCFNGATSEAFPVSSGVKQGCVLAPTLFAIFFSMLLQYAFKDCSEGMYIHTRTDGKLFNIARLRAKTKVTEVLIRQLLFADDAALTSHTEDGLQKLVCRLSHTCKEACPTIAIEGYNLEVVENYTYLGSTISNSLSVDTDVNGRIDKASAVMARLNQRVWKNHNLTEKTKICIYQACVLTTLLYSSEAWTTYASQR
ncbi:RNA-directed DNA polymerase from mobile element jockey-like [Tachysurus ichikawai]